MNRSRSYNFSDYTFSQYQNNEQNDSNLIPTSLDEVFRSYNPNKKYFNSEIGSTPAKRRKTYNDLNTQISDQK